MPLFHRSDIDLQSGRTNDQPDYREKQDITDNISLERFKRHGYLRLDYAPIIGRDVPGIPGQHDCISLDKRITSSRSKGCIWNRPDRTRLPRCKFCFRGAGGFCHFRKMRRRLPPGANYDDIQRYLVYVNNCVCTDVKLRRWRCHTAIHRICAKSLHCPHVSTVITYSQRAVSQPRLGDSNSSGIRGSDRIAVFRTAHRSICIPNDRNHLLLSWTVIHRTYRNTMGQRPWTFHEIVDTSVAIVEQRAGGVGGQSPFISRVQRGDRSAIIHELACRN